MKATVVSMTEFETFSLKGSGEVREGGRTNG